MSLACLVCHGRESPSHSFRSHSVSSSDHEGRCSAIANCLARKTSRFHILERGDATTYLSHYRSPHLVRSRAVRRDLVRDWNFDVVELEL